jgi:hypothetical protein
MTHNDMLPPVNSCLNLDDLADMAHQNGWPMMADYITENHTGTLEQVNLDCLLIYARGEYLLGKQIPSDFLQCCFGYGKQYNPNWAVENWGVERGEDIEVTRAGILNIVACNNHIPYPQLDISWEYRVPQDNVEIALSQDIDDIGGIRALTDSVMLSAWRKGFRWDEDYDLSRRPDHNRLQVECNYIGSGRSYIFRFKQVLRPTDLIYMQESHYPDVSIRRRLGNWWITPETLSF